jgi:predicted phage terminase large subunit-like protein
MLNEDQEIINNLLLSPAGLAILLGKGQWILTKYLSYINEKLVEWLNDPLIRFIIITMPPRHGKSEFISKYLPVWYLGLNPTHNFILVSYEATFAAEWGRKARDLMMEFGPSLFGVQVREDVAATTSWEIDQYGGGMKTAGVGGPITGKGGNILVIDDPIKNAEEAKSETIRQKIKDWFSSTAFTRLTPDGKMILIFTRWTYDDLLTFIKQEFNADQIRVINFPAIAELPPPSELEKLGIDPLDWRDEIGRSEGEALWPEKWPLKRLLELKNAPESGKWFSALYQQRPSEEEGSVFKANLWNFYIKVIPKFIKVNQFLDTAFKTGVTNDYSVSAIWGLTPELNAYLLDLVRDKLEFTDLLDMIYDRNQLSSKSLKRRIKVIIEDKASGQSAIQVLRKQKRLNVEAFQVKGVSKIARAEAAADYQDQLWVPRYSDYTLEFIREHTEFPFSPKDDQVDTTSMMVHRFFINRARSIRAFDD